MEWGSLPWSLFENPGWEFRLQAADCENRLKAELKTEPGALADDFSNVPQHPDWSFWRS